MRELKANIVKDGILLRLREYFPNIVLYDEPIVSLKFPHFFLFQLTQSLRTDNFNRWVIEYFGTIRYRAVAQPETLSNLNEQLDFLSLSLATAFIDHISINNIRFRIKQNQPSEKIDGVLHWFWNTEIRIAREEAEVILQMQLEQNHEIR